MLRISPFEKLSQVLRELGYKVNRLEVSGNIDVIEFSCGFYSRAFCGSRRESWDWLIETKQIKRPW